MSTKFGIRACLAGRSKETVMAEIAVIIKIIIGLTRFLKVENAKINARTQRIVWVTNINFLRFTTSATDPPIKEKIMIGKDLISPIRPRAIAEFVRR